MEFQRRRGRRAKYHSIQTIPPQSRNSTRHSYFTSSLISFIILSSLIGIIYMMLDFHCDTCKGKSDFGNLTMTIAHIAKNLTQLKDSYQDLEIKILNVSHILPKVEGQLEILEALVAANERVTHSWSSKPASLSDIAVLPKKTKNIDAKDYIKSYSKRISKPISYKNATFRKY